MKKAYVVFFVQCSYLPIKTFKYWHLGTWVYIVIFINDLVKRVGWQEFIPHSYPQGKAPSATERFCINNIGSLNCNLIFIKLLTGFNWFAGINKYFFFVNPAASDIMYVCWKYTVWFIT